MRKWYELGPFTVFDLETTGFSPVNNRIVELAAIHITTDGEITEFQSLINPGVSIPYNASRIHHITDNMVKNEPSFHDVGGAFLDFARESTLVAHNARFDLSFLQESLRRTGRPVWNGKTMDTLTLSKRAYPGFSSYSLGHLRERLGLCEGEGGDAHRALTDVKWTVHLLELVLSRLLDATEKNG